MMGRDFAAGDRAGTPPVAIVNQTLARRLWPGETPIGRVLRIGEQTHEVVGVARDALPARSGETSVPFFYTAYWQRGLSDARLFVRVAGDPRRMLPGLRRTIAELDPAIHIGQEMTLAERTALTHRREQLLAGLLGAAAPLTLLLSALGLYGVIAAAVVRRTREIGIRTALGARRGDVLRLLLGEGLRLTALGVALGTAGALATTQLIEAMLYGVSARDPETFLIAALALAAAATLACVLPARRALAVAPAEALRHE